MTDSGSSENLSTTSRASIVIAWLLVTAPLLWGIWQTIKKAAALFR
jgi:hypothetical protein